MPVDPPPTLSAIHEALARVPPNKLNYHVSYDTLLRAIDLLLPLAGPKAEDASSRFLVLLQHELTKVNNYARLQQCTLSASLNQIMKQVESKKGN
jgi:hypothetical protein